MPSFRAYIVIEISTFIKYDLSLSSTLTEKKILLNEQDFEIQLDLCILFLIIIPATPTAYNATFVVSLVSDDLLADLTSSIPKIKAILAKW